MLKLTNTGTEIISIPYWGNSNAVEIAPSEVVYITIEQAQYLKDKRPNDVYTISIDSGATPPDYTTLLTSIKTAVEGIDGDTDDLAPILSAVDGLEALVTTGNADRLSILASVDNILTQAQAVNANTDGLEGLLTSFSALYQAETDATQLLIGDTNTKLDTIAYLIQSDTPEITDVTSTTTFGMNTYKGLSVVVISGTMTLTVGGTTVSGLPVGFSASYESSELMVSDITVQAVGGRCIVTTIK